MNETQLTTLKEVHRQMIDEMILNPRVTNKELAEKFGFSTVWVSVVKCSNIFKEEMSKRRAEIVNPVMLLDLQDRMKGMVDRAMDILDEKLNHEPEEVSDNLLLRSLEIGIKAIGMGNQNPEIKVDIGHLENLANRLIALHDQIPKRQTITIQQTDFSREPETVEVIKDSSESFSGLDLEQTMN